MKVLTECVSLVVFYVYLYMNQSALFPGLHHVSLSHLSQSLENTLFQFTLKLMKMPLLELPQLLLSLLFLQLPHSQHLGIYHTREHFHSNPSNLKGKPVKFFKMLFIRYFSLNISHFLMLCSFRKIIIEHFSLISFQIEQFVKAKYSRF